MHVGHDPVVVAQPRNAHVLRRAGIDGHVLANHVPISDFETGGLTPVLLILRHAADGAEPVEVVVGSDTGVTIDHAMRADLGAGPDTDVRADQTVRSDLDVGRELGSLRDDGCRMDVGCHIQSSSTRMAHMILASATTCPSTVARVEYLQILRLI